MNRAHITSQLARLREARKVATASPAAAAAFLSGAGIVSPSHKGAIKRAVEVVKVSKVVTEDNIEAVAAPFREKGKTLRNATAARIDGPSGVRHPKKTKR